MNNTPVSRDRRKPVVTYDGKVFHLEWRGRRMDVLVAAGGDGQIFVELDGITHWALADGDSEPKEIAIEELGDILDAVESAAEEAGLSIFFE